MNEYVPEEMWQLIAKDYFCIYNVLNQINKSLNLYMKNIKEDYMKYCCVDGTGIITIRYDFFKVFIRHDDEIYAINVTLDDCISFKIFTFKTKKALAIYIKGEIKYVIYNKSLRAKNDEVLKGLERLIVDHTNCDFDIAIASLICCEYDVVVAIMLVGI